MDISDKIWVAVIAAVISAIVSLFAPWVKWSIEKRKLKFNQKVELIKNWRAFVKNFNFENKDFSHTSTYAQMKPHMDEESIKIFKSQRTSHVPRDGGLNVKKECASDQISKIEKRWKLL